jgi:methionyl aminopeptidase
LRKPNKRTFPDYYVIVENPIGLEDIKAKIEKGGYPTLEAVRQDFQLCFNNAKKYNIKESIICKDAKELLVRAWPIRAAPYG